MYSIFLLPHRQSRRLQIYHKVLAAGASLHGAVENIALQSKTDIQLIEDIWMVQEVVLRNRGQALLPGQMSAVGKGNA